MAIVKSEGVTPTERYLAELCERSFLRLWSYPNPFKDDGKELCDLMVVFDDDILIFFDRESHRLKGDNGSISVEWPRWRREVIDKQIKTAKGAARYISTERSVFLDDKQKIPFPIEIRNGARVHKIIVAHGAMEACRAHSPDNISGSLAVSYGPLLAGGNINRPFFLELDRDDPVHVFDSENLGIVLSEFDTIYDFVEYINAKRDAINRHQLLTYCGEEDLVAHYLLNYVSKEKRHIIGSTPDITFVHIGEGEWADFRESPPYKRRKEANESSFAWDRLIQITSQNALNGTLTGNGNPFAGKSAIHFMAKEPRFVRRGLADQIAKAIQNFPESDAPIVRTLTLLPSFFEGTVYVFLQLKKIDRGDYDTEYRPVRTAMLEFACAAAKLKWPDLQRVVGIAIDAPKYSDMNSEDMILMEFADWDDQKAAYYESMNEQLGFFKTGKPIRTTISEFPPPPKPKTQSRRRKPGRNSLCYCGSGMKYKRCCL